MAINLEKKGRKARRRGGVERYLNKTVEQGKSLGRDDI